MTASPDASKETERPGYPIESVDRALSLLLWLENAEAISLPEASENLGVSRSTAYRLLSMLQYRGFVRQDPVTKAYQPGPALLRVGLAAVRGLDVRAATRALLEKFVERVDETAHVVFLQGTECFYLDVVEGKKQIRAVPLVGTSLPAHCTAGGKVLLASLPRYRLDAVLSGSRLPTLTKHSISSKAVLLKELEQIREQGYAVNDEESEDGLRAVAVQIQHTKIRLSIDSAVTISGPAARMTDEFIQMCVSEARKLMDTEFG